MTVRLELTPDIEAGLLAQARASGLSIEAYAERVLRERITTTSSPQSGPTAKAKAFEEWARNHSALPILPAEAYRRENLVRDAG